MQQKIKANKLTFIRQPVLLKVKNPHNRYDYTPFSTDYNVTLIPGRATKAIVQTGLRVQQFSTRLRPGHWSLPRDKKAQEFRKCLKNLK